MVSFDSLLSAQLPVNLIFVGNTLSDIWKTKWQLAEVIRDARDAPLPCKSNSARSSEFMLWEPLFHKTWLRTHFTNLLDSDWNSWFNRQPSRLFLGTRWNSTWGVQSSRENQVLVCGFLWFAAQLNLVKLPETQNPIFEQRNDSKIQLVNLPK